MENDNLTEQEIAAVRALGFVSIPESLAATARAIERGHHVALLAAEGAGRRAVFGYAVGRSCDPDGPRPQALLLTPTRESAMRSARAATRFVGGSGTRVQVIPAGQSLSDVEWPHVIAGRPTRILAAVRAGHLSLGAVRLLVIDGVGALHVIDEWSSVEALMDSLGKEAQKIVVTDEWNDEISSLLTRQLPRARKWPEALFEGTTEASTDGGDGPELSIGVAATRHERYDLVVEAVRQSRAGGAGSVRVTCQHGGSAELVADHLAASGFEAGSDLRVGDPEDQTPADSVAVVGLPTGLDELVASFGDSPARYLIVDAADAKQAALLVRRTGWPTGTITVPPVDGALDNVSRFRSRIRSHLVRQDESADLLLLEPLLEEFGAVRVAAALSALLREKGEADGVVRPWADVEASSSQPAGGSGDAQPPRGVRKAWSRVYVGAGRRDDIRAGDLVGAITGESPAVGGQIGKIEIRGNFSLVDIDSQIVDEVIESLNGTMIKGRQASVRLDREP